MTHDINPSTLLRDALANAPTAYLDCRDKRHSWQVDKDFHVVAEAAEGKHLERILVCSRCGVTRTEAHLVRTDRWGVVRLEAIGTRYGYPDGYIIPEMGRADHAREILRGEQFRRFLESSKGSSSEHGDEEA